MEVRIPTLAGSEATAWDLLFDLYSSYPNGWVVVGAQMVVLHAAFHGVARPIRTDDADVLIDIRSVNVRDIAQWFVNKDFDLDSVSPEGIGHRFVREGVAIDLLSIDHTENEESRTTIPPARTVEVPGGRQALTRTLEATVHFDDKTGLVPIPDWLGSVGLKARAAKSLPDQREKHIRDLILLLGLPVDLPSQVDLISKRERKHLREAAELITEANWTSVSRAIDPRNARAALGLLTR